MRAKAKCLEEMLCIVEKWSHSPTCRQNCDSFKKGDKKRDWATCFMFFLPVGYTAHWITHPGFLHPWRGRSHRLRVLETNPPAWTNHFALLQLVPLTYWPCLLPTAIRGPSGRPVMPLSRLRTWTCGPSTGACHKLPVFRAEHNKSRWKFIRLKKKNSNKCDSLTHIYTC